MRASGDEFPALADDLDRAVEEVAAAAQDATVWERGRPGRWTVGQHTAHVVIVLARTAELFEEAERGLRAGTLPPPPTRRGPLQWMWVGMLAGKGFLPRGLKTASWAVPLQRPPREPALAALRQGSERHRRVGGRLSAAERDRLWIVNPFRARWHYRLPEMVRVHAVHARHHAKQIVEIVGAR